ncbi:MAG: galactose-6-phosphate isomerase subunit LacA [Miniphocaeibacter sp.]|uniref:galactose-6-phosphate isomerase subunit LacA n=1 Tax=Miniphocaeibacter sp. TaxID=3100973 RepID=UPI0018115BE6|nr:galactose-6-phosphate isomerase subunit LacA [Gallicola sp.]
MKVYLSSDFDGFNLKNIIKEYLKTLDFEIVDLSIKPSEDFVESSKNLGEALLNSEDSNDLGILFDAYGAGSFMAITKFKGLVAAEVSDERTGYMTRRHNNARIITLGSEIVGIEVAKNIVKEFINAKYDGGRHQVRVDMLNKMC